MSADGFLNAEIDCTVKLLFGHISVTVSSQVMWNCAAPLLQVQPNMSALPDGQKANQPTNPIVDVHIWMVHVQNIGNIEYVLTNNS